MDLRDLAKSDPEKFRLRITEWLETKTLKSLSVELSVPYPTLYRICIDMGIKVGKSPIAGVTIEDWATKAKKAIADEYGLASSAIYNYWQYHKAELEEGIREYRRKVATPGIVVGGVGDTDGGSKEVSREPDRDLPSSTSPIVVGDDTGDNSD